MDDLDDVVAMMRENPMMTMAAAFVVGVAGGAGLLAPLTRIAQEGGLRRIAVVAAPLARQHLIGVAKALAIQAAQELMEKGQTPE